MTTFKIHINDKGEYYPVYQFDTRLRPVVLYGFSNETIEQCYDAITEIKKCVLKNQNIVFEANEYGYRFLIKNGAIPVAFSRYFPENKLLKKVVLILKGHIQNAPITACATGKRKAA